MGLTFSNRFGKLLKPVLHIELGGASTIKSFRKQKEKKKRKEITQIWKMEKVKEVHPFSQSIYIVTG